METVTLYLLLAPLILGGLDYYFIKGLDGEIRKKRRVWKEKKKKPRMMVRARRLSCHILLI